MIKLNQQEATVLKSIADSGQGEALISYLNRLVDDAVDVRKLTGEIKPGVIEARILFANMVEENLINKLKVLSGQKINTDQDEYN